MKTRESRILIAVLALFVVFSVPLMAGETAFAHTESQVAAEIQEAARSQAAAAARSQAASQNQSAAESQEAQTLETGIYGYDTYGNVILLLEGKELNDAGYDYGDIVKISTIAGKDSQTGPQEWILNYVGMHNDLGFRDEGIVNRSNVLKLIIEGGNFSTYYNDLAKVPGSLDEYNNIAFDEPVPVTISMHEKAGYKDEYEARQLKDYSDERSDYPDYTDEQFANFREVHTTGIRQGVLYRTCSPVDNRRGRNTYADELLAKAGVKTVINLADTPETVQKFEGYDDSYYKTTDHIEVSMTPNYGQEDFNNKMRDGLLFMNEHPGACAIHCLEGKDRTGFVIAVLENLMGASYEETIEDYMISFENYYGVSYDENPSQYNIIADGSIIAQLEYAYDVTDLRKADLAKAAEEYLEYEVGLTTDQIRQLKKNLAPLPQKLKVSGKTVKVKAKTLKKKKLVLARSRALTISGARGKVTYSKVKVSPAKYKNKITIDSKTGSITVKKGVRKGLLKLTVKVKASGNGTYQAKSKNATVKIKVK